MFKLGNDNFASNYKVVPTLLPSDFNRQLYPNHANVTSFPETLLRQIELIVSVSG